MKTAETLAENAAAFVADFLALVADRDAAIKERDAALLQLDSARLTVRRISEMNGDVIKDRDAAIRKRDEALSILRAFVAAEETAKTSTTTSFFEYSDAMDRARELLGLP